MMSGGNCYSASWKVAVLGGSECCDRLSHPCWMQVSPYVVRSTLLIGCPYFSGTRGDLRGGTSTVVSLVIGEVRMGGPPQVRVPNEHRGQKTTHYSSLVVTYDRSLLMYLGDLSPAHEVNRPFSIGLFSVPTMTSSQKHSPCHPLGRWDILRVPQSSFVRLSSRWTLGLGQSPRR